MSWGDYLAIFVILILTGPSATGINERLDKIIKLLERDKK